MRINSFLITTYLILSFSGNVSGQNFKEIENKPFDNAGLEVYWTGAAWVDIDQDGDLDLFLTNRAPVQAPKMNKVLINDGNSFTNSEDHFLAQQAGFWFSVNIVDYNNDGLTDIYSAGIPGALYKNLGNNNFETVSTGDIAKITSAGIASAWGDLDLDGNLDLVLVRPNWLPLPSFFGPPPPPLIFLNSGAPDYRLEQIDTSYLPEDETYLQPTLFDFDEDGDLDILTGMGSGAPKKDVILINKFKESGTLTFERDNKSTMSRELLEGNHWSFADIDNDGDFDAFVTNWAVSKNEKNHPKHNNLFINKDGFFEKNEDDLLVSTYTMSSTFSWGDFDNDGDLDAIEVNDSTYSLKYFQNDGKGNFKPMLAGDLGKTVKHQSGISIGDFDNDGDLDVFIPGPGSQSSLFRNDLKNENNWIKFKLEGTVSNKSAIAAKLYLKSIKNDTTVITQSREVSGSNTFFGSNSLQQHFGLGKDQTIKELVIYWPSGTRERFDTLSMNETIRIKEGSGTSIIKTEE